MAIINSAAIGNSSKSLGIITYRHVRGRTIASQRVTTNPSKTDSQVRQRNSFGEMGRLSQAVNSMIDLTFDKSQYGSKRNNFIKYNKQLMKYIREISDYDPEIPALKNLYNYLSESEEGLKVMASNGSLNITNSFMWDEDLELKGTMSLSRDYKEGDRVSIYSLYTYLMDSAWYEVVKSLTIVLTKNDILSLTLPNQLDVNIETIPELGSLISLPNGSSFANYLIAGIVEDKDKRTKSYISLLPERTYFLEADGQRLTNSTEMVITFKDTELFASKVASKAVGGYGIFHIKYPDQHYPVKGISKDESENPVGLIFGPPSPLIFVEPLDGDDTGPITLMNGDQQIALMGNVISPSTTL